jgi:Zn-dependent peptidase ImmA (M78 family)
VRRPREFVNGDRGEFAVKIAFIPDPHQGAAATRENAASWGAIEFWANGHNICRHVEDGQAVDAATWYLLPILKWLCANWDFLLHEERLPGRNAARDAWISLQRTAHPPQALSEEAAEHWEEQWHGWWQRHSLSAAREGGLIPNLCIRRWRDQIELSWGDRPIAGAPCGFRFDANHGIARFACNDVAEVLYAVLDDASGYLLDALPGSPKLKQLREDVDRIRSTNPNRRKGLISGFRSESLTPEQGWEKIEHLFSSAPNNEVRNAILGTDSDDLVISGPSQAALMFGSLSPTVGDADAKLLAAKLVEHYDESGDGPILGPLVHDVPVEGSDFRAWEQGYQLAEEFLEAVGGAFDRSCPIQMDDIFTHLGIVTDTIALNDQTIRAVALAGPRHRPTVMVNENFKYQRSQPRRFTQAHELCHILHDRAYGARLALASGPWAPEDVEKRANAFAAMLLMPADKIASVVKSLPIPLDSSRAVWDVANVFHTSFTATLEHLYNLGHLDEETRDSLREETKGSPTSSGSENLS